MALKAIGVSPEIVMNHEVYSSGTMEGKIDEAISKRSEIREIIESISGRELHKDWFPYNPLGSDGNFDGVKVLGYENPYVHWIDEKEWKGKATFARDRVKCHGEWIGLPAGAFTGSPANQQERIMGQQGALTTQEFQYQGHLATNPLKKMVYEWIQIKGAVRCQRPSGNTIGPIEGSRDCSP